jgi:hypothetical protein
MRVVWTIPSGKQPGTPVYGTAADLDVAGVRRALLEAKRDRLPA